MITVSIIRAYLLQLTAMSGWTNIKVEVEEGTVDEASAEQRSKESVVKSYFTERDDFTEIGELEYQSSQRHWAVGKRGNREEIAILFEECPYITRLAVTYANDTGDSGTAYMFENDDGDVVKLDEYAGACQARGHDATEYIASEYGFAATPSPRW
jgi:hypothetical protein